MDRNLLQRAGISKPARHQGGAANARTELCDLPDEIKRHDDQRHQQHHGKNQRDHLADDEVMAGPVAIRRAY